MAWQIGARQSRLVVAKFGMVRFGAVRQSCLGTIRRGAVTFGEAQQSWRSKLWHGGIGLCMVWHGAAVKAVQVVAR